jgi:predicted DNA-binding transcriptional regulator AlpA
MHLEFRRPVAPVSSGIAQYWPTKEVCHRYGISRQALIRWRKELGFPEPVYFGNGKAYYPIDKILEWEATRLSQKPRDRAPPKPAKCSTCGETGHTKRTCPNRQIP